MAVNDQSEIKLETNSNVRTNDDSAAKAQTRKSRSLEIDDNYIRQIARYDEDHPSLKVYIIPFALVFIVGIIWTIVVVSGAWQWITNFFKSLG